MEPITAFQGEYRWLSNFVSPRVWYDGVQYPTVEHAYQAAKTEIHEERQRIRSCKTAADAKRAGRTVTMRDDWDTDKLAVMEGLIRQKFSKEPFRTLLIATGDAEIVEGNTWNDKYWGQVRGSGCNHLGRLIMQIRQEIRSSDD